jgi:hypothetical protein
MPKAVPYRFHDGDQIKKKPDYSPGIDLKTWIIKLRNFSIPVNCHNSFLKLANQNGMNRLTFKVCFFNMEMTFLNIFLSRVFVRHRKVKGRQ